MGGVFWSSSGTKPLFYRRGIGGFKDSLCSRTWMTVDWDCWLPGHCLMQQGRRERSTECAKTLVSDVDILCTELGHPRCTLKAITVLSTLFCCLWICHCFARLLLLFSLRHVQCNYLLNVIVQRCNYVCLSFTAAAIFQGLQYYSQCCWDTLTHLSCHCNLCRHTKHTQRNL